MSGALSANQQIIAAYESKDESLSFEEFCSAFPAYDQDSIKLVLYSGSHKYQMAHRPPTENNNQIFTDDLKRLAVLKLGELLDSTNDGVAFKAATYIIDECQGRHDIKRLDSTIKNIINIDDRMKKAKAALDKSKNQKVIDIPSEMQEAI